MFNEVIGPTLLFITIGYLLGSISTATTIAKMKGINIKETGSGNAGATNVTRALGKKLGALTLILDQLKCIITALICSLLGRAFGWDAPGMIQAGAFAAVIGHIYPVFHKFQGGKGAACISGFFLTMNFMLYPFGIILFVATMYATKIVSIATLFSILTLPLIFIGLHYGGANGSWASWFYEDNQWFETFLFGISTFALSLWTHRGNIQRILNGTERKIGDKK